MTPEVVAHGSSDFSFIQIVIVVLGSVASMLTSWFISVLKSYRPVIKDWVTDTVRNSLVKKALLLGEEIVFDTIETETTPLANEFKKASKDGKLSKDEILKLRTMVFDAFTKKMPKKLYNALLEEFEDLKLLVDKYIRTYFEIKKN